MARHQLIISRDLSLRHPVRTEAGQSKVTTTVVVNWTGTWGQYDQPEAYLVVAPQDEIEIVLAPGEPKSSLWFFDHTKPESESTSLPLLEQGANKGHSRDEGERVHIKSETESEVCRVNPALAGDPKELRYYLRISEMGKRPPMIAGQGNPGSLTATKP